MEKMVRILGGVNRQAEAKIAPHEKVLLGASSDCGIILTDDGVADIHCQLLFDPARPGSLLCTAMDGEITLPDRVLQRGESVYIDDYCLVRCGLTCFAAGEPVYDWIVLEQSIASPAPLVGRARVRQLYLQWLQKLQLMLQQKRSRYYAALAAGGLLCGAGLVYAALRPSVDVQSAEYLQSAEGWLKSVAPVGSELRISRSLVSGKPAELLLSGYVANSFQAEQLTAAAKESVFHPRIEINAVEQMVSSMARLTNLESLPCIVSYLSAGQLGCNNEITNKSQADRLQILAKQISGVQALKVTVNTEPKSVAETTSKTSTATAATAEAAESEVTPAMQRVPSTSTLAARKLMYVLMSKRGRYVIDARGAKYAEGDVIDGYTITSIALDQVQLKQGDKNIAVQIGFAQ
jgi:hypothetical protein